MDHHYQNPQQPPQFTAATDVPPSFTGSAPQLATLDLNTSQQFQQHPDPGPKRRPGRPPRVRNEPGSGQPQFQENGAGAGAGAGEGGAQSGRKRGRPPKQQFVRPHSGQAEHHIMMEPSDTPHVQPMPQPDPIAMNGLGPEEEKRRPGRPPKLTPQRKPVQVNGPPQVVVGSDQVVVKRKPGRPAKKNVDGGLEVEGGGGVDGGGDGGGGDGVASVGRPRGRPPKMSGLAPVSRPVGKRPRGRPPRGGGGGTMVVGRGRGRPRKVGGGPPMVRRVSASGKPVGRPRKNAASLNQVPPEQTANEELTKKLDLIQSKIRDVVDVIRPYIPNENAPLMAFQQLEELAAPPLMPTPLSEIAPPPMGGVSGPPPESVSEPYMDVQMNATEPFQVPYSFDNQQRMSWNEA